MYFWLKLTHQGWGNHLLEVECSNPLILLQFLEPPGFSKHQPFLYWGPKILFGFVFELDLGRNFLSLSGEKKNQIGMGWLRKHSMHGVSYFYTWWWYLSLRKHLHPGRWHGCGAPPEIPGVSLWMPIPAILSALNTLWIRGEYMCCKCYSRGWESKISLKK